MMGRLFITFLMFGLVAIGALAQDRIPGPAPLPDGASKSGKNVFGLRSSHVEDGGTLPVEFTGDGAGATLPLAWSGEPNGTKSYAVVMHHIDPQGKIKWYWILYDIPATTQSLPKNVKGVGILGKNSVNGRTEYAPPHSKGPGPKTYIYTLYALSAPRLAVEPADVNRAVLLDAMKDRILGTTQLQVVYSRDGDQRRPPPPKRSD